MEKNYIRLNNELMQQKNGFYQLYKDLEAVVCFQLEIESKMKQFNSILERFEWLIKENYYVDFFVWYSLEDIESIYEKVYSYGFEFQSFMAISKFYKDYALKTDDQEC